jgi:hypothetical protein
MTHASERCSPEFILEDRGRVESADDWESDRAEADEVAAYYKRRAAGVWTAIAVLVVALAAVTLYGYSVIRRQGIQLSQIPVIAKSLPAISQRMVSIGKSLDAWRDNQVNLSAQVQNMDAGWMSQLGETRQETRRMIAQVHGTLMKDMNQRTSGLQAQLSQLASDRNSDRARLAQLEQQLVEARYELEDARKEYASELVALREKQGVENRELVSLSSLLAVQQVTFEIHKNQTAGVAPGVSLKLTAANVRRQQFDGWIHSTSGNQNIFVQNQGVLRPVMFCPNDHDQAMELVVTKVSKDSVAGYLLIPAKNVRNNGSDSVASADEGDGPTTLVPALQSGAADATSDTDSNDLR